MMCCKNCLCNFAIFHIGSQKRIAKRDLNKRKKEITQSASLVNSIRICKFGQCFWEWFQAVDINTLTHKLWQSDDSNFKNVIENIRMNLNFIIIMICNLIAQESKLATLTKMSADIICCCLRCHKNKSGNKWILKF